VAVLEHNRTIVSVVEWGATLRHGIVVGSFTVPEFRQQGFARRLLAFLTRELLKDYPAVKPWVDEDNWRAIALYRSLGFHPIGSCYTGYFTHETDS
jgi:predicted GNAT family acetyltransferase